MSAKPYIRQTLDMGNLVMTRYLNDLSDSDFFTRPIPGMNTIAWQVGHLISVEHKIVEGIKPGASPALPEGFDAQHSKETAPLDDPSKFPTKGDYLNLWAAQHAATVAVLEGLSDEEIAAKAPYDFGGMAPTVGHALNFMGTHALMHVGQFVPVRRQAGKPVVI